MSFASKLGRKEEYELGACGAILNGFDLAGRFDNGVYELLQQPMRYVRRQSMLASYAATD